MQDLGQRICKPGFPSQLHQHRVDAARALWRHPQDPVDLCQRLPGITLLQVPLGEPRARLQIARGAFFGDEVEIECMLTTPLAIGRLRQQPERGALQGFVCQQAPGGDLDLVEPALCELPFRQRHQRLRVIGPPMQRSLRVGPRIPLRLHQADDAPTGDQDEGENGDRRHVTQR